MATKKRRRRVALRKRRARGAVATPSLKIRRA